MTSNHKDLQATLNVTHRLFARIGGASVEHEYAGPERGWRWTIVVVVLVVSLLVVRSWV